MTRSSLDLRSEHLCMQPRYKFAPAGSSMTMCCCKYFHATSIYFSGPLILKSSTYTVNRSCHVWVVIARWPSFNRFTTIPFDYDFITVLLPEGARVRLSIQGTQQLDNCLIIHWRIVFLKPFRWPGFTRYRHPRFIFYSHAWT